MKSNITMGDIRGSEGSGNVSPPLRRREGEDRAGEGAELGRISKEREAQFTTFFQK